MVDDEASNEEEMEDLRAESTAREQLKRSREAAAEAAKAGAGALRMGGRNAGKRGKAAVDAGRETVDRSYRTVTLRTYRDEVDEALQQIVDVLASQDAELRSLRERVELLESRLQDDGS